MKMNFYKENLFIRLAVAISLVVVFLYQFSYDFPEWYSGAGRHFTILYDIAMAIIGSFIFYLVLDYIPQKRKTKAIRYWVLKEYQNIMESINLMYEDLSELYVGERKKAINCTAEDIKCIADNLRNSDIVSTQILYQGNMNVLQTMERCKDNVKKSTNTIISNFSAFLTTEEIEVLSKLAYGKMHCFLNGVNSLYVFSGLSGDKSGEKYNALCEYQNLFCKLIFFTANDLDLRVDKLP